MLYFYLLNLITLDRHLSATQLTSPHLEGVTAVSLLPFPPSAGPDHQEPLRSPLCLQPVLLPMARVTAAGLGEWVLMVLQGGFTQQEKQKSE